MARLDALTAVKRFGFGGKPGELKRIAGDPRGYVASQIAAGKADAMLSDATLRPSAELLQEHFKQSRLRRQAALPGKAAEAKASTEKKAATADAMTMSPEGMAIRGVLAEEIAVRFERSARTEAAIVERLVAFWSNHFCVSAAKGYIRSIAGAFEREAIRPHVLGKFPDMLLAVTRHPAMLLYLDNAVLLSRSPSGLNENLAREILELHTLGVDGGYSQHDVTNLARVLTGWSITPLRPEQASSGGFVFMDRKHEPGLWQVLDKSFGNAGVKAGEDALLMLAKHPSTANNVARRMAMHFVSENPPQALVDRLARSFRQTGGDLRELAATLVASPEAWEGPHEKIVPPYEFLVSVLRGFNLTPPAAVIARFARSLGQPVWEPPSPKGWPDINAAWLSSSGLNERLRVAEHVAGIIDPDADPRDIAENLLGPGLSAATRQAIEFAEGREQGLHLLIMSPEFQRRTPP